MQNQENYEAKDTVDRKIRTTEVKKLLKNRSKSKLVKTCIELADKIDELKEENEKLKGKIDGRNK